MAVSSRSSRALHRGWVALFFLGLCSCASRQPAASNADLIQGSNDATLASGDVFDIRVYGEEELSGSYRVAQDGSIDFPFVGRIKVAGMEAPEVADRVAKELKEGGYLTSPQVSVFLKESTSKRISVVGAVQKPGAFPMTSGLTVVQAISLAGGFTSLADRNETIVSRRSSDRPRRFRVPVGEIAKGKADDPPVQAGDIIYVPERIF